MVFYRLLLRCLWLGGDGLNVFRLNILLYSIENVVDDDSFDLGGCRNDEGTLIV